MLFEEKLKEAEARLPALEAAAKQAAAVGRRQLVEILGELVGEELKYKYNSGWTEGIVKTVDYQSRP